MPYGRKRSRSAGYALGRAGLKRRRMAMASSARARGVLRKYVRRWKSSKRRQSNFALIPRKLGFMQPPRIMVKLRHTFSKQFGITTGDNQTDVTVMEPLRMRDINTAIATENYPEEFVNYARLYETYQVHGVKISAWLYNSSGQANDHYISMFYGVPSETLLPSDPYTLLTGNQDRAKDELLTKKGIRKKYFTGGSGVEHTRSHYHNAGYFGMERLTQAKLKYDFRNHSGQVNADGTAAGDPLYRPAIFHKLIAPDISGGHTGGGATINCRYTITFYCVWSNRRRDLQSTIGGDADEDV